MDVIFDISQIEIFIDNGTLSMCSTIYPDSPYNKISLLGDITGRIMDLKIACKFKKTAVYSSITLVYSSF